MGDDDRDKWHRLPKVSFNKKAITSRMRKIEGATVKHAHKFIIKRWDNVRDVQWHIIAWIMTMSVLIAATGLQLMWHQQNYRTLAPANNGTYVEAAIGPVDTLNPLFANSSAEQSLSRLMFSSILRYDTSGKLGNDLATDVTVDSTGTDYTVKIRSDAKWHDGVKLTTSDIEFTINLMKNSNVRTTISGWKDIETKIIDDTTISFKLPSIYAAFEHILTFPVVPEHILGGITPSSIRENGFSQNPIGSGPFKLRFTTQNSVSESNRKVIFLARNDNYYGETVKLLNYQLHIYDKSEDIIKALELGEVNAAADISQADAVNVDKKKYNVISKSVQSGVYALINTKSTLLSDAIIRRALQLATDVQAIRDKLPMPTNELYLPLLNNQLSGNIPEKPQFNLVDAKNLLDSNGWVLNENGVRSKAGVELKLSIMTMKDSELERALESISGQWRSLGIIINTQVLDLTDITQSVSQNILQPRSYDVLIYQLNIGADPDVYAYWHSSQISAQGSNLSNYSNVISDAALVTARSRLEPELRNAKYITFVKQWLADVPAIGLYQSTLQYAYSLNVDSFNKDDILVSSIDRYSRVSNWSVGSKNVYKTP